MELLRNNSKQISDQIMDAPDKKKQFLLGAKQILPVALAGTIDGLVFGLLARQAGFSVTEAVLFSFLVNAASSQFATLGFISQGVAGFPILISTMLLNARQILYGLSLGPHFRDIPIWKLMGAAWMLNDETYALKSTYLSQGKKTSLPFYCGAGVVDLMIWTLSTLIGAAFGTLISEPQKYGLDFAYIATFIGFLAINLKSTFYVKTALVASSLACLGYHLNGVTLSVILGTFSAVIMGVIFDER
ncbi:MULTISPECIES: AzlC family ABC transporter permease [Aneurinibacillus]|uniref:4-azaleucine resistance probable transporter AzlC n=1 Tax=Aneurinibacillus thermoaerophilus TaxID=143495 RepID=A0A1G8AWG3_ANETH|nr:MULTISPECIES: AzlC family ABC transporter permease [Aneurinibacillus]AMA72803.1 hypothetical protein ACH33_08015 [Aneurinibacillus sp. XH2]MED0675188.1 AzlC family ABC transporter permease [Aneurinibacillus thermoaerophilus]MED0680117.1 AzlC family ABC transporter permease [Aneurinibacillus thermoaerophilus]MED0738126.1 AzlC family ABC transporter permease [Aneurinibacillus thermoaerophilus]MED0758256.1 AzlC family ABC transporter permease [Aneurinibacillus thermoaerophilus]